MNINLHQVSVRVNDSSRRVFTLTSLAVRIAQAMGLHHDRTSASLRPFEREMRLRLWWQILVLDCHTSEDRASDTVISVGSFDARLPLQVNDDDLDFSCPVEVKERKGFTDMTFCLVCHEISNTVKRLNYEPMGELSEPRSRFWRTWSNKADAVTNLQRRIEENYLQHLDLARPFHWMTRMVADVIIAETWLLVYRPIQGRRGGPSPRTENPGILGLSVEILERAHQLNTDPAASPFRWLARTYVQWHALAVTIAELCTQTEGPEVERAWAILEPVFAENARHVADTNKGLLWRPIIKLMNRAKKLRSAYLNSHSMTSDGPPTLPVFNAFIQPPLDTSPSLPFDWHPWLAATAIANGDSNGQGESNGNNTQAMVNWEEFINDFEHDNLFDP